MYSLILVGNKIISIAYLVLCGFIRVGFDIIIYFFSMLITQVSKFI